ncbi:guanylate kinase [Mycoplasma marinum]|uniref:Guanylate kinase n=1 Tax=Mycoplasma marinum TaxID=1937190 RepID=A0A4R0XSV8_9MOLU|nr:guanylate kinase [Mycoplasma marinum]TCG10689.1 guanylate kinase [Mycoplasma marinum]
MKKGKLIVFTGPSAVGKATVEKYLFEKPELKLGFSVSATTRLPREGEKHGKHYFFLTKEEFNSKIESNSFIEWNEHFDNKYGTLEAEVEKIMAKGKSAFLELEPYGAMNVVDHYKDAADDLITIFLAPPSIDVLEKRMRERGTETEEQIKTRLARASEEISFSPKFQYVVINDEPQRAAEEITKIILGRY